MQSISLKQALNRLGAKNVELKKGHCYQYGFYELDGKLYYISTGDVRFDKGENGELKIMYRTAKDRKDWTGGINQWDFNKILNSMGYIVNKHPNFIH